MVRQMTIMLEIVEIPREIFEYIQCNLSSQRVSSCLKRARRFTSGGRRGLTQRIGGVGEWLGKVGHTLYSRQGLVINRQ